MKANTFRRTLRTLAILFASSAFASERPVTTARAGGWGVDDRSVAFGGGVTVTEPPPALRGEVQVEVPRQLLGRPVTALAPGLFADWTNLEDVFLPPSLRAIPAEAFRGCRRLRGVAIPDAVLSIGDRAFADCIALEEAALPAATEEIGEEAFRGCTALRAATMADAGAKADPEAAPLRMGARAFAGCTALETASLGTGGPLEIGAEAFAGCTALRGARLAGTASKLGDGLFRGCRSLRAATVPAGATAVPEGCFEDCPALASISLPPTLVSIGPNALRGCASLRRLDLPPQFDSFGEGALRGCTALRRLELPSGSVRFGRDALAGCDALLVAWESEDPATSAGIPAERFGVHWTGVGAAASVSAGSAGAIPPAAQPVATTPPEEETAGGVRWRWRLAPEGDGAEIVGAALPPDETMFRDGRSDETFSLSIGSARLFSPSIGGRAAQEVVVPGTLGQMPVSAIGPGALAELSPRWLVIPASVRRIGAGAIPAAGLDRLVFLGAPPALAPGWIAREEGGNGAATAAADPLDWLEYPAAFARGWEALLAPPLPSFEPEDDAPPRGVFTGEETVDGVRWTFSVRDGRAFAGAGPGRPALAARDAEGDLSLPARLGGLPVRGLARGAFRGCSRLSSLRIGAPTGFEIGDQAFLGCVALTNLVREAGCTVADIGAEAFRGCTALESFDATGVVRFGPAAFAGCTSLRELRLGPGPAGGPNALPPLFAAGCRALEDVDLPVVAIGRGAFRGCTSLRAVRFSARLRVLGGNAFAGCAALRRADVPASCRRIGPDVFDRCPNLLPRTAPVASGRKPVRGPEGP